MKLAKDWESYLVFTLLVGGGGMCMGFALFEDTKHLSAFGMFVFLTGILLLIFMLKKDINTESNKDG
jgi:hypothetical protein